MEVGLRSGWRWGSDLEVGGGGGSQIRVEVRGSDLGGGGAQIQRWGWGSDLGGAGRQSGLVQVVKVGVGHGLAGRDPLGRVVDQRFLRTEGLQRVSQWVQVCVCVCGGHFTFDQVQNRSVKAPLIPTKCCCMVHLSTRHILWSCLVLCPFDLQEELERPFRH